MPLSLTTRRRQQTSSVKWSTQQHHAEHLKTDVAATSTNNLLRLNDATLRKQRSFIESTHSYNVRYLSRGLSVGRSHDTIQRSSFHKPVLKNHSSIAAQSCNGKNDRETFLKAGNLLKRNCNITSTCSQSGGTGARRVQAWSSNSSILKSLDKELAQLNGVVGKCKDVKDIRGRADIVDNKRTNKPKTESVSTTNSHSNQSSRKATKPEVNKVNLSIVLSDALNSTKEENDCVLSDQEAEEDNEADESDEITSDSGKIVNSHSKSKENKKPENNTSPSVTISSLRPAITAQQRRALYHTSRLAANLTVSNNNATILNSGIQNPNSFNASPSLIVQKRPPLVRAMSAPVRSFDETSKGSSFLSTKRKSRRRKLNTRNISCDKGSGDVLTPKDTNLDAKSGINRKVLTRSKSVAPDVITLVSLISSEGSDSEKEDTSLTPTNSHAGSPARRAPSLRKTGKSENYPPTFQFASKEYSHMLRRSSIAPLAQRIKSNRPPTAPPGSIFHTTSKLNNEIATTNQKDSTEEKENNLENIKNSAFNPSNPSMTDKPSSEEEYEFPEYVRSLKERECWKLYKKMSTKGVNITYDTILRGMLTPTEFRQLQKQREIEQAKALKEAKEQGLPEEKSKDSHTAIERLKESLLKH